MEQSSSPYFEGDYLLFHCSYLGSYLRSISFCVQRVTIVAELKAKRFSFLKTGHFDPYATFSTATFSIENNPCQEIPLAPLLKQTL